MALLSMNEVTTFRWTFEDDVQRYKEAGIGALGVWREKVSDFGEPEAADLLQKSGLKVSNVMWAGGFTGSDGRTFRESVDDGVATVRLAGQLEASCVVCYSGSRAGHTHNHARRLLREALKELSSVADEAGVDLALEPMHRGCAAGFTFLHEIDDTLAVIEQVGSPRLKFVFDTYHLGFLPRVAERIEECASHIALVQLGDGKDPPDGEQNRCRLGEGTIPLRDIIAALKQAGYDGYYDVELLGEELDEIEYEELLRHSKAAFQELVADG